MFGRAHQRGGATQDSIFRALPESPDTTQPVRRSQHLRTAIKPSVSVTHDHHETIPAARRTGGIDKGHNNIPPHQLQHACLAFCKGRRMSPPNPRGGGRGHIFTQLHPNTPASISAKHATACRHLDDEGGPTKDTALCRHHNPNPNTPLSCFLSAWDNAVHRHLARGRVNKKTQQYAADHNPNTPAILFEKEHSGKSPP